MKKFFGYSLLIIIFTISVWLYVSFNGTPWHRIVSASKMEEYIENKYDIEVVKEKSGYNFKMGTYVTEFTLKEDPTIKVHVEEGQNKNSPYVDYYAEALWTQQLKSEFSPLLEKQFKDETILFEPIYGIGSEYYSVGNIPHYSQVEHPFTIMIKFEREFTEQEKEKVSIKIYEIIKEIQNRELTNVELFISYESDSGKTFTTIIIPPDNISSIKSEKDIYPFIHTH
ncbi:hypothetical protein [Bacillus suaedaesalsae]|uniref:YfjL-like N-terminal domain-containing protein n=1 Tax=Bacillus suaedaesalsae TaxID=2810349 RepID=A0ABS2DM07_9BACI|nr:hypothetical protein [Bacillus suaedaesalsae]MBM6619499.1 hypothetical protein [Bacillus suaedaesalsae]